MSRARVVALLAIALFAALLVWHRWSSDQSKPGVGLSRDFNRQGTEPSALAELEPERTPEVSAAAELPERDASSQLPRFGFDQTAFLAELPARLDVLSGLAESGGARALTDVADWTDYCERATTLSSISRAGSTPGDLADASVAAYFKAAASTCADWIARHAWLVRLKADMTQKQRDYSELLRAGRKDDAVALGPRRLGDAIRRRAADAGDDIAVALSGDSPEGPSCPGDSPKTLSQRQEQNKCLHAFAREHLLRLLRSGDPRLIEALPKIIATHGYKLLNGSEFMRETFPGEREARWTLAACAMGLECGPTGRVLLWACFDGVCGYANYRDYVADRRLPPASMRVVEGQLPRLLALIEAGDADTILGPPSRW